SKNALKSPLDEVEGIGPKTKEILLKKFKSLKRIKAASEEEIIDVMGSVKGGKIFQKLQEL
ncbi:MAG: helix-hairpin-helix domain-containing protein, partial [Flavobacteriaceae bacterium]